MTEPASPPTPESATGPLLTGSTLAGLRQADLAEAVREVLAQVERPRVNLGGSGPPGRTD